MKSVRAAIAAICWFAVVNPADVASAQPAENPLPQSTITFVVPTAPGGPADIIARLFAARFGEKLGRTFVVENREGGGFNIGAARVARAPADGSVWLYSPVTVLTVAPWLSSSQGFDPDKDLIPVTRVDDAPILLAVNPQKAPANNFAELVDLSRKRPIAFGSPGVGSPGHLALEYLKSISPLAATHVAYRGAVPAAQALLAGEIDAAFIVAGPLAPHVKSGALKALAVSSVARLSVLPDVPTAAEAGIANFEAVFPNAFMAPAGVSPAIRRFLAAQIAPVLESPDVRAQIEAMGDLLSPRHDEEDAVAWVARERARWGKVIKSANITAE